MSAADEIAQAEERTVVVDDNDRRHARQGVGVAPDGRDRRLCAPTKEAIDGGGPRDRSAPQQGGRANGSHASTRCSAITASTFSPRQHLFDRRLLFEKCLRTDY
jgi:hypothetical protein